MNGNGLPPLVVGGAVAVAGLATAFVSGGWLAWLPVALALFTVAGLIQGR